MPTSYQGTTEEEQALNLQIKLFRAYGALSDRLGDFWNEQDLTSCQFVVLEAIYHLGPLSHTEIARKVLRKQGSITMVVDHLERDDLARRERSEEDRRVVKVKLTDRGEALMDQIFPEFVEFLRKEVSALTLKEQQELARLCKKLGCSIAE